MSQLRYATTFVDHHDADKAPSPVLPPAEDGVVWHLTATPTVIVLKNERPEVVVRMYWTWTGIVEEPRSTALAQQYGSRSSSRPSPEKLGKWIHDLALPILRRSNSIEDAGDVASRLQDSVSAELASVEAWERITEI